MEDYRVPRQKNTYRKFVEKLVNNDVKLSTYDTDYNLSDNADRDSFIKSLEESPLEDDMLDGTSLMFFSRIDDSLEIEENKEKNRQVCDSKYFKDYIDCVMNNPECGYRSTYDKLIKSGYIPKFLSVLIKDCHNDSDKVKAEIFGSRMANLLGVSTVYNFGIKDKNPKPKKWTGEILGDYFAVGSLDFVPYGYHIESFKDLNHGYYKRTYPSLMMWIDFIDTMLNDRFTGKVDEECRKKVHEDFVYTYLFRNILLKDTDFAVYNSGIVVSDDDKSFGLMPNFDMEGILYDYTYNPLTISIFENKGRNRDIAYAMENYPKVTTNFMENLKSIVNDGRLDEVFNSTLGTIETPYLKNNMSKLINNTLDNYEKVHSKIESVNDKV